MALPTAAARLEQGRAEGYHDGAQLAVSLRGEPVADVAVGEVEADTRLPWLSGTKVLTALAVLQQWERGEVHLDDPVAAHIPEFGRNGKEQVTVRHLLTHTSGIRVDDDSLEAVCAAPLEDGWVPGRRAAYRPQGPFSALAEMVRLLDGRPFEEYVRDEVMVPMGMAGSWRPGELRPSTGATGPAHDLLRLYETLLAGGGSVLSVQAVEAMTARHRVGLRDETFGVVIDWGLGIMVNSWQYQRRPTPYGYGDRASPRAFGHGGSQSSIAFADPEHGLAVALVTDRMPGEKANHRRTQPVLTAVYEDIGL
jgi:CubicO group peptidase (beta-lactamase class C family)